jgi:HEAT repeat protein
LIRPKAAVVALALATLTLRAGLADSVPAAGGVRLIENLERAPLAIVGRVGKPRRLDRHAWEAAFGVERALKGDVGTGTTLHIAWEELALSRPVRFVDGDRVLLCLEQLPAASIWLERIPEAELRHRTLAVVERGDAFLRQPSPGAVNILEHYLALASEQRAGPTGVGYLVQLAEGAEPQLALASVRRLMSVPSLDRQIEAGSASGLVNALVRSDRAPRLEQTILELVERRHLESLRPALEVRARADELPPPAVFTALGLLDDGLAPDRTTRLLDHPAAEYRVTAARHATGERAKEKLASLMIGDPAAEVRAAAVERFVALGGEAAISAAASVLYDPQMSVRSAAAKALATQGSAAVPYLVDVVESGDPEAARAAVAGLRFTETREAHDALRSIIEKHPDPGVRTLAELALGRPIGHEHK